MSFKSLKRQKTDVDINQDDSSESSNTSTQPEGATTFQTSASTPVKVKEENDRGSLAGHPHLFIVKFNPSDNDEYTIQCDQPCTVLEAIKSDAISREKIKSVDENIIIQLGKEDNKSILPTHFPCSCITHGESLIISCKTEKVEQTQDRDKTVYPRDEYSVFYIDTVGGENAKTKTLFRSYFVRKFKYLCVYGRKGMTVEEALKRDGRFIDRYLGEFILSHNDNPNMKTTREQKVDFLHQKEFKICLPKEEKTKEKDANQQGEREQQGQSETRSVSEVANQRGKRVMEKDKKRLHEAFPDLKKLMESGFPGNYYQKKLEDMRKENFGKIQQAFSEVHRVGKLRELGKSVCKVVVQNVCTGTGFVLFDGFILTNAHLFKYCVCKEKKLQDRVEVFALFNYDDPEPHTNYYYFTAETTFIDIDFDFDYAVLKLKPEALKPDPQSRPDEKMPPGLLHIFGPLPSNGEACLIGHPAGEVKRMDPVCIIEKEKREQAVMNHLQTYKDHMFIVHSVIEHVKDQGIGSIMEGGKKADKVGTYNTFMYHGASGSPVFDAFCRVFGLHTSGYTYGFPNHTDSVIEYAMSVLTIFKKFVGNLKESVNDDLLNKIQIAAGENEHLIEILNAEPEDSDEEMVE